MTAGGARGRFSGPMLYQVLYLRPLYMGGRYHYHSRVGYHLPMLFFVGIIAKLMLFLA